MQIRATLDLLAPATGAHGEEGGMGPSCTSDEAWEPSACIGQGGAGRRGSRGARVEGRHQSGRGLPASKPEVPPPHRACSNPKHRCRWRGDEEKIE
jgi:hypothetical protein